MTAADRRRKNRFQAADGGAPAHRGLWWRIRAVVQKLLISASLFDRNELINHAAASALFLLLAIPPFFLLLIIGLDRYLSAYPEISRQVFAFLRSVNENLDRDFLVRIGLLRVRTGAIGALGVLSLLWAGGRAVLTVRRGLSVVFSPEGVRNTFLVHVFSMLVLLLLVGALLVGTSTSVAVHFVLGIMADQPVIRHIIEPLLPYMRRLVPIAMTMIMVFLSYRFVPPHRPGTFNSAVGAVLCAAAVLFLHSLFARFTGVARYSMIYGVTGSVILLIIWIHLTFVLFFFAAQFVYVLEALDTILIERLYLLFSESGKKKKKAGWMDRQLLTRPERFFHDRLRRLDAGRRLFCTGDAGRQIFFLFSGEAGIYREENGGRKRIAKVRPGEMFGETAYLLEEPRSATVVAEKDSVLLEISGEAFDELVLKSPAVSRGVIRVLSRRLRQVLLECRPMGNG